MVRMDAVWLCETKHEKRSEWPRKLYGKSIKFFNISVKLLSPIAIHAKVLLPIGRSHFAA